MEDKFIQLYEEGLSIKDIAKKCKTYYSKVNRHLHKLKIELKKRGNPIKIHNSNYNELTPIKAYILGVIGPGDGFIEYRQKEGIYRLVLEATDIDFTDYFAFCLKKVYGLQPRIEKVKLRGKGVKPSLKVVLQSKEVCKDILSYNADFKEKTWTIPEVIKLGKKEIQIKYLQAFADSQGCVAYYPSQKSIILASKNVNGIEEIRKILTNLGIENQRVKSGISITAKKNLEEFSRNINFIIKRKREKLHNLIENYKITITPHKKIIELKPQIIKLRQKALSYPKIANLLNISTSTAWRMEKETR